MTPRTESVTTPENVTIIIKLRSRGDRGSSASSSQSSKLFFWFFFLFFIFFVVAVLDLVREWNGHFSFAFSSTLVEIDRREKGSHRHYRLGKCETGLLDRCNNYFHRERVRRRSTGSTTFSSIFQRLVSPLRHT